MKGDLNSNLFSTRGGDRLIYSSKGLTAPFPHTQPSPCTRSDLCFLPDPPVARKEETHDSYITNLPSSHTFRLPFSCGTEAFYPLLSGPEEGKYTRKCFYLGGRFANLLAFVALDLRCSSLFSKDSFFSSSVLFS